jgi:glycerophosphoryl diester phosphodiesterase
MQTLINVRLIAGALLLLGFFHESGRIWAQSATVGAGRTFWQASGDPNQERVAFLLGERSKPVSDHVIVVAHRGDGRNYPENSNPAPHGAAAMGVEMIGVDVERTRDGILIAMPDETLDRITSGKGRVKDFSREELQKLKLRRGTGMTRHRIPSFEEYMLAAKGATVSSTSPTR